MPIFFLIQNWAGDIEMEELAYAYFCILVAVFFEW